nr:NBS-LRR type disease resistance protein [Ipomoea batatas]GMC51396.1 NBS-LRR type disease resistance protein [Ipomoea batatas]
MDFNEKRGQVLLPANICVLQIENCVGLNGCMADYFQSMSNLRELRVGSCWGVEWIFNSEQITENAASTPFKSLEKLDLISLPNLVSVCKGEDVILPECTFSSLKHLSIDGCDSMKKLLPHTLLQNLKNLEILEVSCCRNLEVVIGVEGNEEEGIEEPTQLKVSSTKLGNPHGIEGCKLIITSHSLEVCRRIGCKMFFKVDAFNEKEAWNLFKEILLLDHDHLVLSNEIEELAKSLAKKYGGLPLALKTVAASMRGIIDDHVGRNSIKNFQNASLHMFEVLSELAE